jgi:cytochrome c
MKDCFEGKAKVQDILIPITDFHPPLSEVRDLPKDTGAKEVPGQKTYEASCAVCHATDAMGAPDVGNKAAWDKVMEQGMETVLKNAINGKNGMPPKGGTSLPDDKIKEAIEYMVGASK